MITISSNIGETTVKIGAWVSTVGGAGRKLLFSAAGDRTRRTRSSLGSGKKTVRSGTTEHAGKSMSPYHASTAIESAARDPETSA